MTQEPYTYTQDPGHGWIAVPRAELRELGIADQITSYSYVKSGVAYLEEDQDATTWSRAFQAKYGRQPDLVERHVNSTPIRRYAQYEKPGAPTCPRCGLAMRAPSLVDNGTYPGVLCATCAAELDPEGWYLESGDQELDKENREPVNGFGAHDTHALPPVESELVFPEHTNQISDADPGL